MLEHLLSPTAAMLDVLCTQRSPRKNLAGSAETRFPMLLTVTSDRHSSNYQHSRLIQILNSCADPRMRRGKIRTGPFFSLSKGSTNITLTIVPCIFRHQVGVIPFLIYIFA